MWFIGQCAGLPLLLLVEQNYESNIESCLLKERGARHVLSYENLARLCRSFACPCTMGLHTLSANSGAASSFGRGVRFDCHDGLDWRRRHRFRSSIARDQRDLRALFWREYFRIRHYESLSVIQFPLVNVCPAQLKSSRQNSEKLSFFAHSF